MKRTLLLFGLLAACNQPPTAPQVTIEPAEPKSVDELTLVFEAESIDQNRNDVVNYDIRWFRNDTEKEELRGELTVPAVNTISGQRWRVEVVPSDGVLRGGKGSSEVDIHNTAPQIDTVVLTPDSVRTLEVLEVSYAVTDLDDDLTDDVIAWEVNGMELTAHGRKISGIDFFDKHDEVQAFVTANDGKADSERASSDVVIVDNTRPTEPEIALVPEEPRPNVELYCHIGADSTDEDDDVLTYLFVWRKDGGVVTTVGKTVHEGDTVQGDDLGADEEWTCEVRASDGDDTSTTASASAVVRGGTVPGFDGVDGPLFRDWLQCEGYLDKSGGDDIPVAWADNCTDREYGAVRVVCGASDSSYRYIDVKKNVFRDGLSSYPESGLITRFADDAETEIKLVSNLIYAQGNNPNSGRSWWIAGSGCGESTPTLTVNNSCPYEASNCFGQNISSERYLWVYVKP
ncbi:MAG: hypothetical protein ACI9MC_001825 [Kiritimatiellia bacterium]|jgi:hypothetical protein